MINNDEKTGIVLFCDSKGTVNSILCNELAIDIKENMLLSKIEAEGSVGKVSTFIQEIALKKVVFNYEINVLVNDSIKTLSFTGISFLNKFFIIADLSKDRMLKYFEDIMKMNNEHINEIRDVIKDNTAQKKQQEEKEHSFFNEISRLNNELVNANREIIKNSAELKRLNLMKNQLLGMAAHDLRNPLGAISSYSQFLYEDTKDTLNKEQLKFLEIIQHSSKYMKSIVDDLLDISIIESGNLELKYEKADLINVINNVISINRILASRKGIEILFDYEEVPEVTIDVAKIEQVVNNLISNAVKFSYKNSKVVVSVFKRGMYVLITVKDDGQGIPREEINKLFKPFGITSVKSTMGEKNTGLGLLIARKIVESHSGNIDVTSKTGVGSKFIVSLPISNAKAEIDSSCATVQEVDKNQLDSIKILLVDDNGVNSLAGARIIGRAGYDVTIANSGMKAVEACQNSKFDLIFMDIEMPYMDGFKAAELIRQNYEVNREYTYIVALTAHASNDFKKHCLRAGMNDCIQKPINIDELTRVILECKKPLKEKEECFPVDIEIAVRYSQMDKDLLLELVNVFFIDMNNKMGEIKWSINNRDSATVKNLIHPIISSSAYIGAIKINELLTNIEDYNDFDMLEDIYEKLIKEIDRTKTYYSLYFNKSFQ